ncbi:MAG TPA: hypothetical protein VGN20_19300 [Mucilaginibacter sp.]|jgi:hypothetical protein
MIQDIVKNSKNTYQDLRDLRGLNLKEILSNMPICKKDSGYSIDLETGMSVRSIIYKINSDTTMEFETAKEGGLIIIWRNA